MSNQVPSYGMKPAETQNQKSAGAATFRRVATAVALGDYLEILSHAWSASSAKIVETPSSPFASQEEIAISIEDYAKRLGEFLYCSPYCFSVAAVLADKLYRHHPHIFTVHHLHRVMAALFVVAIKTTDDQHLDNRYFAECIGLSLRETNLMERHILTLLDYCVFVTDVQCVQAEEVLKKLIKLRLLRDSGSTSIKREQEMEDGMRNCSV